MKKYNLWVSGYVSNKVIITVTFKAKVNNEYVIMFDQL